MIINIRGTCGSGKSHIVRHLMQMLGCTMVTTDYKPSGKYTQKNIVGYCMFYGFAPIYVLGAYPEGVFCGGCDVSRKSQDTICDYVRHFSSMGNVIFEGMTVSLNYGRYRDLSHELVGFGERYVWAFLDTPLEVCIDRVIHRHSFGRGNKPESVNTELISNYHSSIIRVKDKAIADGLDVVVLKHDEDVVWQVLDILSVGAQAFSYKGCTA